jgi:hypothetical protein
MGLVTITDTCEPFSEKRSPNVYVLPASTMVRQPVWIPERATWMSASRAKSGKVSRRSKNKEGRTYHKMNTTSLQSRR